MRSKLPQFSPAVYSPPLPPPHPDLSCLHTPPQSPVERKKKTPLLFRVLSLISGGGGVQTKGGFWKIFCGGVAGLGDVELRIFRVAAREKKRKVGGVFFFSNAGVEDLGAGLYERSWKRVRLDPGWKGSLFSPPLLFSCFLSPPPPLHPPLNAVMTSL